MNLKKLRLSRGLSQQELAELAGVSEGTLSRYENFGEPLQNRAVEAYREIVDLLKSLPKRPFKPISRQTKSSRPLRRLDRRPSPTELYRWYVRDNLTAKQIAESIGWGERTVSGWLADYGIYKTAPRQDFEFCKTCGHLLTERHPVQALLRRH